MAKALWEQLLDGTYDPLANLGRSRSSGGFNDAGVWETSFERRAARSGGEFETSWERRRRIEREKAEGGGDDAALEAWLDAGRGRTDELASSMTALERRRLEAQALGIDEDGEGPEGFLSKAMGTLDWGRSAVFNTGREVADVLTGGSFDVDELRDRIDRREGFGDLSALQYDEDDRWWERGAKAVGAFAGDVATDPLTYLAFGTTLGRRVAGEAVEQATRRLGGDAVAGASDEVARGLARRVPSGEMRTRVARAADIDPADVARMSADDTWQLARLWNVDRDLAADGLAYGATQSYLAGGSRGLRSFLTDAGEGAGAGLGRDTGEAMFSRLPDELRGGARFRVPFVRDTSELGLDLGVRLPKQVRLTGGGGRTSQMVPGMDRLLDGAEWTRRAFRESKAGRATAAKLGGAQGWAYGPMVASIARMSPDTAGQEYGTYSGIVRAAREAAQADRGLDNQLATAAGGINSLLRSADDRQVAESAMREAFMSRGKWDDALMEVLPRDVQAGYRAAQQSFAVFNTLHADLSAEYGPERALGFINNYLARQVTDEWKVAKQARSGQKAATGATDPTRSRSGVFARFEPDDEGGIRVAEWLTPEEANNESIARGGVKVFEDDPMTVLVSYANRMKRAISEQRLVRRLMDNGVIQQTGWDGDTSLYAPAMAKVGGRALARSADDQAALREAFELFAAGDREPLRGVLGQLGRRVDEPEVPAPFDGLDGLEGLLERGPAPAWGGDVPDVPLPARAEPPAAGRPPAPPVALGAARAGGPEVTVAPGAIEVGVEQQPDRLFEALFVNGGRAEDGSPAVESILAMNEGSALDPLSVRPRTDDELAALAEGGWVSPADFELVEWQLDPARLGEAQARYRHAMDQRAEAAGWVARVRDAGVDGQLEDALARRKMIDLGPSLPGGDEFASMWPIIDTLSSAGWRLDFRPAKFSPNPNAARDASYRLVPPKASNRVMDEATQALADRGLRLNVVRERRVATPKVDVEVDVAMVSPAGRDVLDRSIGSAKVTVGRDGMVRGTLAELRKVSDHLDEVRRRVGARREVGGARTGFGAGARRRLRMDGVRFTQDLEADMEVVASQLDAALTAAEAQARSLMPEVDRVAAELADAQGQVARLSRSRTERLRAAQDAEEVAGGGPEAVMRRAEAAVAEQDARLPQAQARLAELEGRMDTLDGARRVQIVDRTAEREASWAGDLAEWEARAVARADWEDAMPATIPGGQAARQATFERDLAEWEARAVARSDWEDLVAKQDADDAVRLRAEADRAFDQLFAEDDRWAELLDARNIPVDPDDADVWMQDVVQQIGRRLDEDPERVTELMERGHRIRTAYGAMLRDSGEAVELSSPAMKRSMAEFLDERGAFGPPALAEALPRMYRAFSAPTSWETFSRDVYKPYYTWFKGMATVGGGPRFFIRNVQGGVFNAWLQDVSPQHFVLAGRVLNVRQKIKRQVRKELGETTPEAVDAVVDRRLPDALRETFGGERGERLARTWTAFEDQHLRQGILLNVFDTPTSAGGGVDHFRQLDARSLRRAGLRPDLTDGERGPALRAANWTLDNPVFNQLADATEGSETFLRFGSFLKGVEEYGLDDGGFAASLTVKASQFDYADLSEFEIRYLKNVLPFYTWSRKNLPLAARSLVTEPGKVARILHANDALKGQYGAEDDEGGNAIMPRWVRESFGWETRATPGGGAPWAVNQGWWPTRDLNTLVQADLGAPINMQEVLSSLNPMLTTAVETATGTSTFTRAQFQPTETAPSWAKLLKPTPFVWDSMDGSETMASPRALNVPRSLMPLLGTFDRLVDPALRVATGRVGDEDRFVDRLGTSAASQLAGLPVSTLDARQQRAQAMSQTDTIRGALRSELGSQYSEYLEVVRTLLAAGWEPDEIRAALEANGGRLPGMDDG